MIVEILCFYSLTRFAAISPIMWMLPIFFDIFAFMPQSLIGYLNDKYPKLNVGLIGSILLIIGKVGNE